MIALLKGFGFLLALLAAVAFFGFIVQKTMASIQRRKEPNVAGIFRLIQAFANELKRKLYGVIVDVWASNYTQIVSYKVSFFLIFVSAMIVSSSPKFVQTQRELFNVQINVQTYFEEQLLLTLLLVLYFAYGSVVKDRSSATTQTSSTGRSIFALLKRLNTGQSAIKKIHIVLTPRKLVADYILLVSTPGKLAADYYGENPYTGFMYFFVTI
jgi:hypothetical protein